MNRDRRVDDLLAPLRDELPDANDAAPIDRERVVARMMSAAKATPPARTTLWVAALAVAAAFAVGFGAMRWLRKPGPSDQAVAINAVAGEVTWRGAGAMALKPGESATVETGGHVTTASAGEAHLKAASGVEFDVYDRTDVGLDELRGASSSLRLFEGRVRCKVPHLAPSATFSVVTSDVRVVVHGTVFSVEASREGIVTVRVDEGVVSVHYATGDVTLTASQSWSNQRAPEPATPVLQPVAKDPREASPKTLLSSPRKTGEPSASPSGTLDEETRLLRSGLAAERSGDLTGAAASFNQLLTRFPQSPLAPDARAALVRVRSHQRTGP